MDPNTNPNNPNKMHRFLKIIPVGLYKNEFRIILKIYLKLDYYLIILYKFSVINKEYFLVIEFNSDGNFIIY